MAETRTNQNAKSGPGPWEFHVGHEELIIRKRYEVISICNDILIGIWFLVGSFLFFSESTMDAATWLFVIGSAQMLIRPVIRLTRRVHIQRMHGEAPGPSEASHDF